MSTPAASLAASPFLPRRPRWLRGAWGWVGLAAIVYTAAFTLWSLSGVGSESLRVLFSDLVYQPVTLLAALAAARIWRDPPADARTRRAWGFISLAMLANFIADSLWFYFEVVRHANAYPAWPDVWYLLSYPLTLAGLLALPYSPIARH